MTLVIAIVLAAVGIAMLITSRWSISNTEEVVERNMMDIAQMVSNTPTVIEGLKEKPDENMIQPYIRAILNSTKGIDLIVVADMNGIRYAHPVEERIGERVVGGDDKKVIEEGISYLSVATGTLGSAVRAFVPVKDENGQQLGYVIAGTLIQTIGETKEQIKDTAFVSTVLSLSLGIIGAILIAESVKKDLLGLEPEEISKMYVEKQGMLDTIHEGIIAIDENSKITLINDSAFKLLGIKEKNIKGKNVEDIVPNTRLQHVLETGIAEYDREQVLNNAVIITNRVPIYHGEKRVGAIATFRDKTNVIKLAEELTGVRQIVDGLRANNHEFMNKLHVISGLIELGELEEAKRYIVSVQNNQQQIINLIMNRIKDPTVAGLIVGKFSRAKELGIRIKIEEDSILEKRRDKIDSNRLLAIIGNLLENAMDAINAKSSGLKEVHLKIKETKDRIEIVVQDTGVGIKNEDIDSIFIRGFSTKDGNRGIGLALIKEAIENLNGKIEVTSQVGEGTRFAVMIPKEEKND